MTANTKGNKDCLTTQALPLWMGLLTDRTAQRKWDADTANSKSGTGR